jgi:GT2 family glycosyltransferase
LIGDSSPAQVLSPAQVVDLAHTLPRGGGRLTYRYFDRNRGSAGGNNDLFRCSDSELVLIINPDCYASPGLVRTLRAAMDDPDAGIVEARQVPLEHPKEFDRRTGDTSWASGSCMLVRRHVVELLDGFDEESFFMYCDDVDFSWRARLHGYRVVYQPAACVFHDKRLDAQGQIVAGEAEVYYSAEASLMMAWKWSRPDVLEMARAALLASGSAPGRQAVDAFDERRAAHRLPTPLDPGATVSQFIGHDYARHRFGYDD